MGAPLAVGPLGAQTASECAAVAETIRRHDRVHLYRPGHRRALEAWATSVGYRRLWVGEDVVELAPCPGGRAETRCSGCRVRLVDTDVSFWEFVRRRGAFPGACCLCGSDLPQWTVARQSEAIDDDPASSMQSRRTTCR